MARVYIPVGSVTGTATAVAQACAQALVSAGHEAQVDGEASVSALTGGVWDAVLVVTATTGRGNLPSNLVPFYEELEAQAPSLEGLMVGVISLGDSSYDTTFCQAGATMEERLLQRQGKAPVPRVTIDATETQTPDDDALFWLREFIENALT